MPARRRTSGRASLAERDHAGWVRPDWREYQGRGCENRRWKRSGRRFVGQSGQRRRGGQRRIIGPKGGSPCRVCGDGKRGRMETFVQVGERNGLSAISHQPSAKIKSKFSSHGGTKTQRKSVKSERRETGNKTCLTRRHNGHKGNQEEREEIAGRKGLLLMPEASLIVAQFWIPFVPYDP